MTDIALSHYVVDVRVINIGLGSAEDDFRDWLSYYVGESIHQALWREQVHYVHYVKD